MMLDNAAFLMDILYCFLLDKKNKQWNELVPHYIQNRYSATTCICVCICLVLKISVFIYLYIWTSDHKFVSSNPNTTKLQLWGP